MILPIQKLQPGMRLARDVTNVNGGVLLFKGTELTSQHLAALSRCGLSSVHIAAEESAPGEAPAPLPPHIIEAAEIHVKRRFQHLAANTPGLSLLKEIATKRCAARQAERESSLSTSRHPA